MLDWIKSHKILFVLSCIGVITMLFGKRGKNYDKKADNFLDYSDMNIILFE